MHCVHWYSKNVCRMQEIGFKFVFYTVLQIYKKLSKIVNLSCVVETVTPVFQALFWAE